MTIPIWNLESLIKATYNNPPLQYLMVMIQQTLTVWWFIYFLGQIFVWVNTSFGRIFVWVNTSFPRSTFPTASSRSRFSFGKLSRHCNIDSIILTCSVTNGNYWHRIVRFSMREVLSFFDIHFSSNRIHNKKDLTYIILDLFLSKQKTDVSI